MANTENIKLDVRAYPIAEPKGNTLAFASVTINDIIGINGIRIVNGKKGLFAAMPQAKDDKGEYRDIAFPVTKDLRLQLNKAILDCYAAEKEQVQDKASVKDQLRESAANKDAKAEPGKDSQVKGAQSATRAKASKAKASPEH